ncbi:hypothetical protein SKAU_G00337000 [Synaphobranchus kaupii]|uniref:Uncharacterized protein n=1 Tax=Synaphobranchus kaupii TaxID=118154 RepID=A0A9Q1EMB8_SYNKA|nr:hypothetical protein SKAU_G00337000 [Synaphobranchus kaupii]
MIKGLSQSFCTLGPVAQQSRCRAVIIVSVRANESAGREDGSTYLRCLAALLALLAHKITVAYPFNEGQIPETDTRLYYPRNSASTEDGQSQAPLPERRGRVTARPADNGQRERSDSVEDKRGSLLPYNGTKNGKRWDF